MSRVNLLLKVGFLVFKEKIKGKARVVCKTIMLSLLVKHFSLFTTWILKLVKHIKSGRILNYVLFIIKAATMNNLLMTSLMIW